MEPAESVSGNKTIVMASGLSAPKRSVRYTVRDGDGRSVKALNPAGGPNSSPLAVTGKSVEPCPFRAWLMQAGGICGIRQGRDWWYDRRK